MTGQTWTYIIVGGILLACCFVPMLFMKKHRGDSGPGHKNDPTADSDPNHPM